MAHYAYLNKDNIVEQTFVGVDEGTDGIDWEKWYTDFDGRKCLRYSINTRSNIHLNGKEPFRKNLAGIGWIYNEEFDGFHEPQPYSSWILNPDTCTWQAPIEKPVDENRYSWNEDSLSWEVIPTSYEPE